MSVATADPVRARPAAVQATKRKAATEASTIARRMAARSGALTDGGGSAANNLTRWARTWETS